MAAGSLAAPGTEYGPCVFTDCGHSDCAATRKMASEICAWCDDPIGYDRRFYRDPGPPEVFTHAVCEETAIEEGRA